MNVYNSFEENTYAIYSLHTLYLLKTLHFPTEEGWLDYGWEEFTIPAEEISLTNILSHTCEETVFRYGYS